MSPPDDNVPGENLLAVPPVNRTVMEGDNVEFECVTKDANTVVNWLRDGLEIEQIEVQFDQFQDPVNSIKCLIETFMKTGSQGPNFSERKWNSDHKPSSHWRFGRIFLCSN